MTEIPAEIVEAAKAYLNHQGAKKDNWHEYKGTFKAVIEALDAMDKP